MEDEGESEGGMEGKVRRERGRGRLKESARDRERGSEGEKEGKIDEGREGRREIEISRE